MKMDMVEEQVQVEVIPADFQVMLASKEGKAGAKFKQEPLDVLDNAFFEVALALDLAFLRKSKA